MIATVNRIRREHPSLQQDHTLRFLRTDNERLLAYAKTAPGGDVVVTVVNLDPQWKQSGFVEVPTVDAGGARYEVDDLISGEGFDWRSDQWNYVELDPAVTPAHVLHVHRELLPEGAAT
jgi:starch synthase (maltosyl-transferring)